MLQIILKKYCYKANKILYCAQQWIGIIVIKQIFAGNIVHSIIIKEMARF